MRLTALLLVAAFAAQSQQCALAADADDKVASLVVELLGDKDKDMRALGLQQVREEAKGTAATKQFAAALPKLAPDVQAALLSALGDRGDKAARPAVLEMVKSSDAQVRAAAIAALGPLGETADVPLLVDKLSGDAAPQQKAAADSLALVRGSDVNAAIAVASTSAKPAIRAELLGVLLARRAADTLPTLLAATIDSNAQVRSAAMAALAELAGPDQVADMLKGVLKSNKGTEREAAERAVMAVCQRSQNPGKQAAPVLAALAQFSAADQLVLLSTLGRVGGPEALKTVEAAIADSDPQRHEAGLRALANWPNASVAPRLLSLTQSLSDPELRSLELRALIRVAVLKDKRSDADRLKLLMQALPLSTSEDERLYIVHRARAVRTVEALRFLLPFLDQPALAQEACGSVLELAHHRELRVPNKEEFDRALDKVIAVAKSPKMVDEAQHYKRGETFNTKTQE